MKIDDLNYQNVQSTGYSPINTNKAAETTKAAETKNNDTTKAVDSKTTTANSADKANFSADTKVTKKMSDSERASLVQSLKADMNNQMDRFMNMMTQMFQKQGIMNISAQGNDLWRTIASGNFTVDAQTKAEAQEAISEDGYWGVKQTSQRIFDFAYALAGDDPDKMKQMQDAVAKGFDQATKAWGRSLPSISHDTLSAVNNLFDNYYSTSADPDEE